MANLDAARALHHKYTASFATLPQASASIVLTLQQEAAAGGRKCVLIDVRTDDEQAVSMLPGAVSRGSFERSLEGGGREAIIRSVIIPYCTIGFRSGHYCATLRERLGAAADVRNGEGLRPRFEHGICGAVPPPLCDLQLKP